MALQGKTMNIISLSIGWIFGLLFLIIGIDAISESFLGGLSFILISFLLLPPIRSLVFSQVQKEIPSWARGLAIFLLIITFGIFMTQSKKLKTQEIEAQLAEAQNTQTFRQKNISYFNQNSAQVLKVIKRDLRKGKYEQVVSVSEKYLPTQNKELIKLHSKANSKLVKFQNKEEKTSKPVSSSPREDSINELIVQNAKSPETVTRKKTIDKVKKDNKSTSEEILAKLKDIPASKYKENQTLYQQLVDLNPDKKKYERKLKYYTNKINKTKRDASEVKNKKNDTEGESDSTFKSKELLAKLKNIPASEYENNRDLYQQLVDLNPDKNKYKKKLEHYSRKIAENTTSSPADDSNDHLSCKDIQSKKKFINTPEWLSTNGHCLSKKQKKKMEMRLLANVRKLSTKKTRKNRDGYKALSILNPGNNSYIKKLNRYEKKYEYPVIQDIKF